MKTIKKMIESTLLTCIIIPLLAGCAPTSPQVRAYLRDTPSIKGPFPTWARGHWIMPDGTDVGVERECGAFRRGPLYYYNVDLMWQLCVTNDNVRVGTAVGTDNIAIIMTDANTYIYGPTLKSIRTPRKIELSEIKSGHDIIYVTAEGTFKASELTD